MRTAMSAFLTGMVVYLALVVMGREARADDAKEAFRRGGEACEKGDFDEAIADFTEAIRFKPDYALAYCNRGTAYGNKGDSDKAIVDLTEAIRLKPDADAYNLRGLAYGKKGDHDKEIADFSEAIRLKPGYAEAYRNRGGPTGIRATTTKRLPTSPRPSGSSPITPRHTTTVAWPTARKAKAAKRTQTSQQPERPGNRAADVKPTPGFDVMSRDGDRFVEGRIEAVPSSNSAKIIVQARNFDLTTENGRKKAEAEIDDATNVSIRALSKSPPFRDQPLRETRRQDSQRGTTLRREVQFDTRMRTWTDSTGTHHVEAEFVDVKDKTVGLKKKDGTVLAVPLAKLSEADHEYIGLLLLCKTKGNDETLAHLNGLKYWPVPIAKPEFPPRD